MAEQSAGDISVAFIGLGNMGGPMASNVVRAGYRTTVLDLDPDKVTALTTLGATAAASVGSAVAGADVVLTSLPGPSQLAAIGLGPDGIIDNMAPGATWVDLSTNDLACGERLREAAAAAGIRLLDAPVSGGTEGAEAGTLLLMVGGDADVLDDVAPLLTEIGDRVEHLGPLGAGYTAKITQVILCYLNSVCLTEALLLGAKGGVDPAKMLAIIQGSTGASYVADRYGPPIVDGSYDPSFSLELAHKDLRLAINMADSLGADLPTTADVTDLYAEAEQRFGGEANHLIAVKLLEQRNGLRLNGDPA